MRDENQLPPAAVLFDALVVDVDHPTTPAFGKAPTWTTRPTS
ncbi:hypothetical protein [Streptomyces sp. NRRL WC-3618]|nr:hypothetical protein [Streptomyces sp. NRRL WC-3618]